MVEVGSIEISGALDDSDITRGFDRITNDFKEVENQANQANASFSRLSRIASNVGIGLVAIGTAGVGALTALATKSPALAGSLSTIEVNALKLGNTFGRTIKPIFDEIGQNLIPSITDAIVKNQNTISSFVDVAVKGVSDISSALSGDISSIENLFPKTGMAAIGAAAGYALMGPKGLFIGAALGLAAAENIEAQKQLEIANLPGGVNIDESSAEAHIINIGKAEGISGKTEAAFRGGPLEFVYDAVLSLFNMINKDENKKTMSMASANGIPR